MVGQVSIPLKYRTRGTDAVESAASCSHRPPNRGYLLVVDFGNRSGCSASVLRTAEGGVGTDRRYPRTLHALGNIGCRSGASELGVPEQCDHELVTTDYRDRIVLGDNTLRGSA
ncbi:hypothetical protein RHA1_ro10350 (plasmid) [Rhodococcus jostii RHA1]|uniref:Uncharacterized protein n=1 Tax=Rhodococcus jostii (strain RHA1) TaxID=101510 RepID=Q0RVZ7_RHOJR|nr:hypothetical protein RHA1_ro10350 [Rhodococcus jostii RHA1]